MSNQFKLKHRILSEPLEARVLLTDLAWSSYLGGSDDDSANSITTDSSGNVYVTGRTSSTGWISGGFDTSYNGGSGTVSHDGDAFVMKLSADGEHLWSTYLGGAKDDYGYAIATDSSGNVYVTGSTESSGWVSGGYDVSYNGGTASLDDEDAFVVKLSPTGVHLWSTYLGGTHSDIGAGITTDSAGNVYVTGNTNSSGWIKGGFNTTQDSKDGFVVNLSSTGNHRWSTYLGGSLGDYGSDIVTNSLGDVYVTGLTESSGWISGGFDTSFNGGDSDGLFDHGDDAFVIKLNSTGNHLWSSYLGGTGDDYGNGLATDSSGNVYVTGRTQSYGWVSGGFDSSFEGSVGINGGDAFVVKLSPSGEHRWSTYLGGTSGDYCTGIATDSSSNVYVTGHTFSTAWVSGGFDTTFSDGGPSGSGDGFVVKLSAVGTHLWSTYLGSNSSDYGTGIAISSDHLYVSGTTSSSGWVHGGFDESYNDDGDAFISKIVYLDSVAPPPFNIIGTSSADSILVTRTGNTITSNVNGIITNRQISNISSIYINAGRGNDTITIDDDVMGVTVNAGSGNDRIIGTDNGDLIFGGTTNALPDENDDYILARGGNDTVYGGSGKDTLTGSAGKDKLYGENDEDRINGGKGNDTIFGGSGEDRMYGNEDNDYIDGGGNIDRAWGDTGNDTLIGGGSNDKLYGEGGNDRFFGNAGADLISGGSGTDSAKDEDDENLYSSIESYF